MPSTVILQSARVYDFQITGYHLEGRRWEALPLGPLFTTRPVDAVSRLCTFSSRARMTLKLTSVIFIEARSRAASTSSKLENVSDPLPSIQRWISFISLSDCSSLRPLSMMISAMRKSSQVRKYGHQCDKGI